MTLALPEPTFRSEPWPDSLPQQWLAASEQAAEVARRAGTGHRYPGLLAEAERLLEARDVDAITARLHERLFARAVAELWATKTRLAQRSMTPGVLGSVAVPGHPVSRLTTISLLSTLLRYFDQLDDWEEGRLEAICSAVDRAVRGCRVRPDLDVVEVVRAHAGYLSSVDGPRLLARDLIAAGRRLEDDPVAVALCHDDQGRYAQLVRNAYYLGLIETADPSSPQHDFLVDVADRATRLRRDDGDRRFGIAVLAALCDKPDGAVPSEQWVDTVLEIGGDPRHESSARWRDWWGHLDASLRERAVRWMTGADLRAFLDAVRVYGEESDNEKLQRMFPRRHRFLMGLYESGRVRNVRLILGADIRATVRRVTKVSLFDAATYKDQAKDTAVVMVDCGDFHLVEGSHNFRLHAYLGPPGPELSDPRNREYTKARLIHTIPERHKSRHPDAESSYDRWTHDIGGSWIRNVLDFLRHSGIRLDESKLVAAEDLSMVVERRQGIRRPNRRLLGRRR